MSDSDTECLDIKRSVYSGFKDDKGPLFMCISIKLLIPTSNANVDRTRLFVVFLKASK